MTISKINGNVNPEIFIFCKVKIFVLQLGRNI